MGTIGLVAKGTAEERIAEYLEANASEALRVKIAAAGPDMKGLMRYLQEEAGKLQRRGDCVAVDADTVFGWAVHYYEDVAGKVAGKKGNREDGVAEEGNHEGMKDMKEMDEDEDGVAEEKGNHEGVKDMKGTGEDGDGVEEDVKGTEESGVFEGMDLFGGEA